MVVFGVKGCTRPEDLAADGEKDAGGDVESGDDDEGENERGDRSGDAPRGERGDDGEKEAAAVDTGRASSGEGVDGVDVSHDTRGAAAAALPSFFSADVGWTSASSSSVVVVGGPGSGWGAGAGEAWRDRAERGGGGGPARLVAGAVLSASFLLLAASSSTLSGVV
ncbi:uncharacterized protein ACA1_261560 [Acanthamoeba castellanii str. Neff]|uniref:Uncharacterized protein n=1 Tax=Acanthamoeba castellanii (strain ATCC 30010 / Neff) TaxID=1257118 RepID=L8GHR6_ACACF|nr:uncharacterized protein ACA1_261560 [Acanthamoeba castellanii str. Neff]ELR11736.1 hypothetical protein ACA1_261560 [Acanthamoeba castellanii str. Neff]